jgi:protein involved in polysaccharide export with SLBB domain
MRVGPYLAVLLLVIGGSVGSADEAAAPAAAQTSATAIPSTSVNESPPGLVCADTYRVCPGDTLYITVEGEELFTRECQVNAAGTISYPMLGDVSAAGATCGVLQERLEAQLQRYLKHPRVMVTIQQYGEMGQSVYVMGEVQLPGVYPFASGTGVMLPIAAAGGLTEFASGRISIIQGRTGKTVSAFLDDIVREGTVGVLEPGDVVLVERKEQARYAVLGEVPNPGMFDMPIRGEVRVLDAVMSSGLLEPPSQPGAEQEPSSFDDPLRVADLEHAKITRGDTEISVDLVALVGGDTTHNIVLQAGDVLTIPRRSAIQVYALGEVRDAGRVHLPELSTVLDLIEAADGITAGADGAEGSLLRMVEGAPTSIPVDLGRLLTKGDVEHNIALQEGDVLFVPAKGERNQNFWRFMALMPYLVL